MSLVLSGTDSCFRFCGCFLLWMVFYLWFYFFYAANPRWLRVYALYPRILSVDVKGKRPEFCGLLFFLCMETNF